jgi:hypothetical protein
MKDVEEVTAQTHKMRANGIKDERLLQMYCWRLLTGSTSASVFNFKLTLALSSTIGRMKRHPDELMHLSFKQVKMRQLPHMGVILGLKRL